jgi:tight adherence protein C
MTPAALVAGLAVALAALGTADAVAVLRRRERRSWLRARAVVLLARLGRSLGAKAPRALGDRVAAAGLGVSASDVMGAKAGAAVVGLGAAVAVAPAAPGRLAPVILLAAPAAAFCLPDAYLRRRTRRRRRAMEAELADVLDLLRVAVAAGLAPKRALAEVGRRHPGTFARELRRVAGLTALGIPAADALAELERRCPTAGIAPLTAALGRAERHGAPLGPALAAQAARAREHGARRTVEAAARAAPQIQLVVALLLVPAVMLLVAAALLPALTGEPI